MRGVRWANACMLLRLGSRRAAHQPSPVALDGHKLSEFRVGELAQLCRLHHGVGEGLFVLGLCEEGKREREGERGRERERERESVRFAVTLGAAGQEYPYQPDGLQPLGHVVHLLGKRADFTIHTGRKTRRRRRAARRVTRSPQSLGWASFAPRRTCDCCTSPPGRHKQTCLLWFL